MRCQLLIASLKGQHKSFFDASVLGETEPPPGLPGSVSLAQFGRCPYFFLVKTALAS